MPLPSIAFEVRPLCSAPVCGVRTPRVIQRSNCRTAVFDQSIGVLGPQARSIFWEGGTRFLDDHTDTFHTRLNHQLIIYSIDISGGNEDSDWRCWICRSNKSKLVAGFDSLPVEKAACLPIREPSVGMMNWISADWTSSLAAMSIHNLRNDRPKRNASIVWLDK